MEYKYEIYQLNDSDEATAMRFISYGYNMEKGRIPRKDLYNLVYSGTGRDLDMNNYHILETIYHKFNVNKPMDFRGHSLSTSDVVVLNGKPFYCDYIGFKPLTEW